MEAERGLPTGWTAKWMKADETMEFARSSLADFLGKGSICFGGKPSRTKRNSHTIRCLITSVKRTGLKRSVLSADQARGDIKR